MLSIVFELKEGTFPLHGNKRLQGLTFIWESNKGMDELARFAASCIIPFQPI